MGVVKKLISLFLFLVSGVLWGQQITVEGKILNIQNRKLNSVNVLAVDSLNQIMDYTYSDKKGNYRLQLPQRNKYTFVFSSLGYANDTVVKYFSSNSKHFRLDAQLKPKHQQLDEVFLQSENPIKIRKDTVSFKADYFSNGTEETVEDLLRKIPGLHIDENGIIKVGNREVEKVMVEGDDFFGQGYKILTKNMPAHPIKQVNILKHYSANELLKGIEESNKVALNLTLKGEAKRIWFGTVEAEGGNNHFYKGKFNLMNFGKKNSYYFLGSLNNIGEDVTGDISSLIYTHSGNEPGHIGDNQKANKLIGFSASTPSLGKARTRFSKDQLVSLNAIFNPSEKLKVKPLMFFNREDTDFYRLHTENVSVNNTQFTNTEDYALHQKNPIAFGKLDLRYDINKTEHLKFETRYNNGHKQGLSSLLFNGNATRERLDNQHELIDQDIRYTNRFDEKKVFLLTGRFINEHSPQHYRVNRFYYEELFPDLTQADNVKQYSSNSMQFMGIDAHLLNRYINGNLLELEMGNTYRRDKLHSSFSVFKSDSLFEKPDDYQNQTFYRVNDWYARGKYQLKFYDFSFTGKVELHQLFNSLEGVNFHHTQYPFFVNPYLGIRWEINKNNRLSVNYAVNTSNAGILDVYPHEVLTGFRSFQKGTGDFDQLKASHFNLHYRLGNWSDRFFAHATLLYFKNHDFFSTSATIRQGFTQTEKLLIKDREMISTSAAADYFLNPINSNFKLKAGYSKSNYKNLVNGSNLRSIQSIQYNYGFELRSSFGGVFDFHIGTQWKILQITTLIKNSYTDNHSFLDLYFRFSKQWDAAVKSSLYHFGNLQTHKNYGFLDFEAKYKIIKNKLTLKLTGKNLFDTRAFRNYSVSDIGTSITGYQLLPRMILFSAKFRL